MRSTNSILGALAIAAGIISVGGILAVVFGGVAQSERVPLMQSSAIMAAVAGWLFNNSVNIKAKLREKAFELIDSDVFSEELMDQVRPFANFSNINQNFQDISESEIAEFYFNYDFSGKDIRYHILRSGDIFEYMALAIRRDAVDEEIVKDYFEGIFRRVFENYRVFLGPIRNLPSYEFHRPDQPVRPDVGEQMEWLYRRWFS